MKCENIKNLLYLHATGEIDSAEKALVEKHLSECAECSSELNGIKHTLSLVDKYKRVPKLNDDYFSRYTEETINKIRVSEQALPSFKTAGFYLKPAIALLLIFAAIFTFRQLSNHKEQPVINDMEIAQNMDLYQNMDVIENINEIENL